MKCRSCGYALWTIRARECPECGTAFRPSEYDFVPNAVRFCCPHCDRAYYGIGRRGHIEPSHFVCTSCEREIDIDEMVLRPAEGVDETAARVDAMPWLERRERGRIRAWLSTIAAAMTRPASLMRAVPRDASVGQAFMFMATSNFLFVLAGQLIPIVVALGAVGLFLGRSANAPPGLGPVVVYQMLFQVPLIVASVIVAPVLWWLCAHGLLRLVGGATAPLARTGHAIFYGVGPYWLKAVPCDCAGMTGWIWWIVSATLMVKEAHRCGGARATFAVVTSSLVTTGMTVVAAVAFALAPMGMLNQITATGGGGSAAAADISSGVAAYGQAHGGQGPRSAVQLLFEPSTALIHSDFVLSDTDTTLVDIPVGDVTLEEVRLMPENRARMAAESAAEAMPPEVIAHRVGDFVLTYHGANLAAPDPQIWIVIAWPDPDTNPPVQARTPVAIGLGDGSTTTVTGGRFATALAEQNRYRASRGLPPLPLPSAVTHDRPALAAD